MPLSAFVVLLLVATAAAASAMCNDHRRLDRTGGKINFTTTTGLFFLLHGPATVLVILFKKTK